MITRADGVGNETAATAPPEAALIPDDADISLVAERTASALLRRQPPASFIADFPRVRKASELRRNASADLSAAVARDRNGV